MSSRRAVVPGNGDDQWKELWMAPSRLFLIVLGLEPFIWVAFGMAIMFSRFESSKENENIFFVRPHLNFSKPTVMWSVSDENACLQGTLACTSTVVTTGYETMDVAAALFAAVFLQLVWPALRLIRHWTQGTFGVQLFNSSFDVRMEPFAYDGAVDTLGQIVTETLILVICAHVIGLRQIQYPLMLTCLVLMRRTSAAVLTMMMGTLASIYTPIANDVGTISTKEKIDTRTIGLVSRVFALGKDMTQLATGYYGMLWALIEVMPLVVLWTSLMLAWDSSDRAHPRSVTVSLWMWFAYHMLEAAMVALRPLYAMRAADIQVVALQRVGFMLAVIVSAAMLRNGMWGYDGSNVGHTVSATTMIA